MKLSEERISHIAHMVFNRIYDDDVVDFYDEETGLREIKRAIEEFVKIYEDVDSFVRGKIESLKNRVPEGSLEWEILYKKYFEDEVRKKKKKDRRSEQQKFRGSEVQQFPLLNFSPSCFAELWILGCLSHQPLSDVLLFVVLLF
jgi:hypothetical protein